MVKDNAIPANASTAVPSGYLADVKAYKARQRESLAVVNRIASRSLPVSTVSVESKDRGN